ncbi:MAG: N-acetylmuramoyl-L-alanine amidase [Gaiellales bacterium]
MISKISDPCNKRFHANQVSGIRPLTDVHLIVMHVAENPSAESVAADFSTTTREASAHLVVDDTACYRCLENDEIPMAAPGANTDGFHIEQAGFASWSAAEWETHLETIQRAAYKAAFHCKRFGLPAQWLEVDDLLNGQHGITDHFIVNQMAKKMSLAGDHSHTCPGTIWPRKTFMKWVHHYHETLSAG